MIQPRRPGALLAWLWIAALCLSACAKKTPTPPTPAPTETQTATAAAFSGKQDVIILSSEENGYAHLFAYAPGAVNLTRLTAGAWNDIEPAISPDGKRIAFASNRSGFWDLYTLNLQSGKLQQLTNTPAYDAAPTWSPDLAWIAYETDIHGTLQIALLSLNNPDQGPVLLTNDTASSASPAWAPNGRQIAFVSNRSGDADIWLADLDKTGPDRFTDLRRAPLAADTHPVWNADGSRLAWASATLQTLENSGIYVWTAGQPDRPAAWLGDGDWPAWNAPGDAVAAGLTGANQQLLTAYALEHQPVFLPVPLPGHLHGLIWPRITLPKPLPPVYQQAAAQTPPALWTPGGTPAASGPLQRASLVQLQNVQAPYPQLHELASGAFEALRQRVIQDAGWDGLASLENAFVPLTTALDPGLGDDWLYTGRAFALNSLMVNAGWLVIVREDVGSQTYWRLYLRTQKQDGSQGGLIGVPPWDLNARYALDPVTYEAGGKYAAVPPGYWIDLTALAQTYGWERVPALPNWRSYYAGTRFNEFVLTGGLDWQAAMLQLYPAEALLTPTPVLPPTATPSITAIPSSTAAPTRTPRITFTPSSTATPPRPTVTP